jgi:F-type H+-transporting ATPase subunit epsilon
MFLEIISPDKIIFSGEIQSISVPGVSGYFQILENHAPIISSLKYGKVTIKGNFDDSKRFESTFKKIQDNTLVFNIQSGTIETKKNKVILLSE